MLPIILIGAGLATIFFSTKGFGLWGKDESGEKIKFKKLAVLGPKASGKSHLLSFLKTGIINSNKDYAPTSIMGEKFEEIVIEDDGRKLLLQSTTDPSGAESSIRKFYEKLIDSSSDILFVFNCSEFLMNEEYRNFTLSIVDFINRHNTSKKLMIFLGSHFDQLIDSKNGGFSKEEYTNQILENFYKVIDVSHLNELLLINMLNENDMKNFKKALFN